MMLAALLIQAAAVAPAVPTRAVSGVALPLHAIDPAYDYARELAEIDALGARWVSLLWHTRQADVRASQVPLRGSRTPSDERIRATIRAARSRGLDVLCMPVVLLERAGPGDWRGHLRPDDLDAWWASYTRYVEHAADLAAEAGAAALCVGSELGRMESSTERWVALIRSARGRFPGWLTYSANWDHYDVPTFWHELDAAGISAYFSLSGSDEPTAADIRAGWIKVAAAVERLAGLSGLPVLLTEVGIPSVDGALSAPWDHARVAPPDHAEQALGFAGLREVLVPERGPLPPGLRGLFLYDWWGPGGPGDRVYTARGKPAEPIWREILGRLALRASF